MTRIAKSVLWLFVGVATTAVVVPVVSALKEARPIFLVVEHPLWIVLVSLGGIGVLALIGLRDREQTASGIGQVKGSTARADPVSRVLLAPPWSGDGRRHSLAFVIGAASALMILPIEVLSGEQVPEHTPTFAARTVEVTKLSGDDQSGAGLALVMEEENRTAKSQTLMALMIDGDRNGQFVLFDHEQHRQSYGEHESCIRCHHVNKDLDRATPCFECHADMLLQTDVFSHQRHIDLLEDEQSCAKCHRDPGTPKTRATATACSECHPSLEALSSQMLTTRLAGIASGYARAMHGLCIDCHVRDGVQEQRRDGALVSCAPCHPSEDHAKLKRTRAWSVLSASSVRAQSQESIGQEGGKDVPGDSLVR